MRKVENFARFYAILKRMPTEAQGHKEEIIFSYTNGRTSSLREMTNLEYQTMCDALQGGSDKSSNEGEDKKRRLRRALLCTIAEYGIDSNDWEKVNSFCLGPRVMGKEFSKLSIEELRATIPKVKRMIAKKKEKEQKSKEVTVKSDNKQTTSYYLLKQQTIYS